MTIGIYCISFEGTDKVYIGQSTNIEARWQDHLRTMVKGTAKRKVLEAYITYGEPTFSILTVCGIRELDGIEISLIEEFDSINNGFNTCAGGKAGSGVHNGSSVYTEAQILEVLELLSDDRILIYSDISSIVDVSYNTIVRISKGETHTWLNEKHPAKFQKQLSLNLTRLAKANITIGTHASAKNLGITYPTLIGPDGMEYSVDNALQFAKIHALDHSCIVKVLNGYRKSHKGYFLKYPQERASISRKVRPPLVSPTNTIVEVTTSLVEFAELHSLNASSLSGLFMGRIKVLKGWRLAASEEAKIST